MTKRALPYKLVLRFVKKVRKVKQTISRRVIRFCYTLPLKLYARRGIIGRRWLRRLPKPLRPVVKMLVIGLGYTGRTALRLVIAAALYAAALFTGVSAAFAIVWAVSAALYSLTGQAE